MKRSRLAATIQAVRADAEADRLARDPGRLVELGTHPPEPLDFAEFFTECAPRLHRWIARRWGSDQTGPEDLVQEVFTQAWKHWEKVGRFQNPHAWVFLVAGRMVRRYHRRLAAAGPVMIEARPSRAPAIDGLVDFARALTHMPVEQRRTAFLVFALEYTPAEAAQVLGLNPSTVRSYIYRARQQISRESLLDPPGTKEG